jgi:hypothetical protein
MPDATPTPSRASASTVSAADAAAAREAVRRRRWKLAWTLAAISVGWKLLVFTLGAAMPHWLIDDGVAQLPLAMQPYGIQARETARELWNGPLERHGVVRKVRVVSVYPASTSATTLASDAGCRFGARVRAYTYFAIPYSEVRTVCGRGVVEYRVFRRRGPKSSPQ